MKHLRYLIPACLIFFLFTGCAHALRSVPIIPMKVAKEVDVFVRKLDVDNTPVGGYIDIFTIEASENDTPGSNTAKKNDGVSQGDPGDRARAAAAKYMNAALIPLIQNALTRSGMFWRIRGVLEPGEESKPDEDLARSLDHTYVIFEPSLSVVSGLKNFSGSLGFIINQFLEFEKSQEWIYLTLNLKAEIYRPSDQTAGGSQPPRIINDYIMVPLAKWNRTRLDAGIDKRILLMALSQVSATGIVQEVLNLFTKELKEADSKDTLGHLGFKSISSVSDPVQAVAFAIYQSAYRITKRLDIHRAFRQRVVGQLQETSNGKSQQLLTVDGFRVFMPDPLNITKDATRFRIYRRADPLCASRRQVYSGELFTAQPFSNSVSELKIEMDRTIRAHGLEPKDFREDFGKGKGIFSILNPETISPSLTIDKTLMAEPSVLLSSIQQTYVEKIRENGEQIIPPLNTAVKSTQNKIDAKLILIDQARESANRKRLETELAQLKAILGQAGKKLRQARTANNKIKKKYQAVRDILQLPVTSFAVKFKNGADKQLIDQLQKDDRDGQLSLWVVEVDWDWYVNQYTEK